MPLPKSVELAGVKIEEVLGVTLSVETPVGPRGFYEGRTGAATVKLIRRARNTPTSEAYKYATNEDGRLALITGKIVLENSHRKETYTIELTEAYISGWEFTQPPEDDALMEVITIKAGVMTLAGGGKSIAYKVPDFNKNV